MSSNYRESCKLNDNSNSRSEIETAHNIYYKEPKMRIMDETEILRGEDDDDKLVVYANLDDEQIMGYINGSEDEEEIEYVDVATNVHLEDLINEELGEQWIIYGDGNQKDVDINRRYSTTVAPCSKDAQTMTEKSITGSKRGRSKYVCRISAIVNPRCVWRFALLSSILIIITLYLTNSTFKSKK